MEAADPCNGRFAARSLIVPNTKSPLENILSFSRGQLLYCPMIFGVRAARPAEPAKPAACLIIWNNGNPENSIKTVSSGCHTPRKAHVFRHFRGLYCSGARSLSLKRAILLSLDTVQFYTLYLLTPSPSPRVPHPHPGGYRGCCKVATITARIPAKSQKRSTLAPHLAPIS